MESRIRMQPVLALANRLPPAAAYSAFAAAGEGKVRAELAATTAGLQELVRAFDRVAVAQWNQNAEIVAACGHATPLSDAGTADTDAVWTALAARARAFRAYQNDVLDRWFQRTQIGFAATKKFKAVNVGIVQQVEQILQDRPRLLKRARTHRAGGRMLGRPEAKVARTATEDADAGRTEAELVEAARAREQSETQAAVDADIYDDTDFYGELLRELIEESQRTDARGSDYDDAVATTELTRLRNSLRRKKHGHQLSKGRTVRYDIIPELVNFTAPVTTDDLQAKASEWDTAQLFANLFGSGSGSASQVSAA